MGNQFSALEVRRKSRSQKLQKPTEYLFTFLCRLKHTNMLVNSIIFHHQEKSSICKSFLSRISANVKTKTPLKTTRSVSKPSRSLAMRPQHWISSRWTSDSLSVKRQLDKTPKVAFQLYLSNYDFGGNLQVMQTRIKQIISQNLQGATEVKKYLPSWCPASNKVH